MLGRGTFFEKLTEPRGPINFMKFLSLLSLILFSLSGVTFAKLGTSAAELEYKNSLIADYKEDYVKTHAAMAEESNGQIVGSSSFQSMKEAKSNIYFLYGAEHLNLTNYYFDIPVTYNDAVKKWIRYFIGKGKDYFVRYSERAGRYAPILGKILEDYGLPRDLIFLAMAESGFNNNAKSWAKAVGPWQFMPYTGKKFGLKINFYVDERQDPIKATIAAAKYLRKLKGIFGSWELAAAGYNAGEGKIGRAIKRYGTENFWQIRQGRYLKRETKNYVPKIMALAIIGKNLESFGLSEIDFNEPLDFDEVDIKPNTDLILFAKYVGIPFEEIQRLNPEIMRWHSPPNENYKLRMPVGFKQIWDRCCDGKDFTAKEFQTYKLRSNTSLSVVSRKFKLPKQVLADLNGLSVNSRVKKGQVVKLPFRIGQSRRDEMYSDLYEVPYKRKRRHRRYWSRIRRAKRKGKLISNPKQYYRVRKGDTIWSVSKKFGVSMDTIIRSNLALLRRGRMLRPGDSLVVK